MNNSLKNLEIKFMQKNVIVVEGNVYDLMIKKTDQSISIYTIFDKISEISKNNGYRFLVTYNPSRGRTWLLGSDTNPNEAVNNKEDNFLDVYDDENKNEKITDFLNYVAFDIEQSIKLRNMDPKIYVIDFADFYFDNATSGEVIESMIKIISALLERKYVRMQEAASLNNLSKVIFITREANNLTRFLSTKNDEYASVMITKPNIEERKEIFISSSVFDTEDAKELRNLDSKKQLEAVALTDGFTCKEILQLGRLNINAKTFKELYMVAQFNKKDSEWEKMDTESVSKLDIKLKERVKGQEYALSAVRRTLINSFLGMNGIMLSDNMTKPKGILFFAGPTGVGKTELAKAIAEFVFGDENRLIRFDMSEFNHEHSDQRLIGAPPGYVGYDAGGELTNKIKENPFSVLLFDEIEKAHGKIMDKFLQILEDGRLTSAKGELIDFSETFIIFTSNIGANDVSVNEIPELNRNKFIEAVCKHFTDKLQRPELLNRIGIKNIIPFDFIKGKEIVDSIISIKLDKLFKALKAKHNINLISKGSKTNLLDLIGMKNDFKTGGRGIVATIETVFVDNLNIFLMNNYDKIIIRKRNEKILNISFSVQSEKIIFSIE